MGGKRAATIAGSEISSRGGIHGRILPLLSRSWAQGQEKASDIASGDPLARGARTLRYS